MHNSNTKELTCSKTGFEFLKVDKSLGEVKSKRAIFMFHGYGASMNDLYGLEGVIHTESQTDWIFPNGPLKISLGMMMEGRAWFPIDMQELERAMQSGTHRSFEDKEPAEFHNVLPKLVEFINEQAAEYDEIILGGFSQGAMITSHLIGLGVEKVSGFILMSGTLLSRDILINNLESKKPIPFIQSHGKLDPVLNFDESMKLYELFKLMRFSGEFVPFDGAHEIPPVVISKVSDFINK